MAIPFGPFTLEFETDPVKNAEARFQDEQFDRNWDWLEAHASEVFSHRGKVICIAGKELFVGDDVLEVRARAKVAHPEDQGHLDASNSQRTWTKNLCESTDIGDSAMMESLARYFAEPFFLRTEPFKPSDSRGFRS